MVKETTSISIDHILKGEFKKTGMQLSTFVEDKIKEELQPEKQIQAYKQRIEEYKNKIKYLETRIIELKEKHGQTNLYGNIATDEKVEKAIDTCLNIYNEHKIIGENQIKNICEMQGVDLITVKTKLELREIPIIPTYQPPKQTTAKNLF